MKEETRKFLPLKIQRESLDEAELYAYLAKTPLAKRVDLGEYIPKVLRSASMFTCRLIGNNRLIGLSILYMNDPEKRHSFCCTFE